MPAPKTDSLTDDVLIRLARPDFISVPANDLYLIDKSKLFREALKALLPGSGFALRGEAETIAEAIARFGHLKKSIVLIEYPSSNPAEIAQIKALGDGADDALPVILASKMELDALVRSLAAGARGFLLKDISFDALVHSLLLVLADQKVLPTELAALLADGWREHRVEPDRLPVDSLTGREWDVLRALITGESNKVIGRALHIAEATVKVHIKGVLKKLNLHNRTQAAVWAANGGLDLHSPADTEAVLVS
jgi:two-component system, NarL family, nitrate/nitrite response regulator NarL